VALDVDVWLSHPHELELFAQKIIAARDAEWVAEPVCYQMILPEGDCFDKEPLFGNKTIPLFSKPKEVK